MLVGIDRNKFIIVIMILIFINNLLNEHFAKAMYFLELKNHNNEFRFFHNYKKTHI